MKLRPERLPIKKDLNFERIDSGEDLILYVFNQNAVVAIDTSERPFKELPEILFGHYNHDFNEKSLRQPDQKVEDIDMEHFREYISEVARDSGIHEFLLFPYGGDAPGKEHRRSEARLRLFKKYFNLKPSEKGVGYILSI